MTIDSLREGIGVGRALLDAVRDAAVETGCRRLWLVTTNDNVRALKVYQRWGMDLVALRRDAVTEARTLKPTIPERDADGIPLKHELELELLLEDAAGRQGVACDAGLGATPGFAGRAFAPSGPPPKAAGRRGSSEDDLPLRIVALRTLATDGV